jgi:hypothetical protein
LFNLLKATGNCAERKDTTESKIPKSMCCRYDANTKLTNETCRRNQQLFHSMQIQCHQNSVEHYKKHNEPLLKGSSSTPKIPILWAAARELHCQQHRSSGICARKM